MDPLSIATSAAGIVSVAFKVSTAIYSFINDSRNVDSNVDDLLQEVLGLSRCSEAISQTWAKNPMIAVAQTNGDRDLWISVKNSMDDCQRTLRKLDNKLDELKQGSTIFARGFMRRPNKLIRLNMSAKEIDSFRQQMHSHNNGMQSALLMINVCLLLSSNSSQDSIARVLIGLKTQIGRVESALQGQNQTDYLTPGVAEENQRIANNLRKLVRAAESVHSSASTVVGDARSTVWGGSVMGDALSDEQYNNIQNWIPPATIEEEEPYQSKISGPSASQPSIVVGSTSGSGNSSDQDSDDSDIERHLTKRYRELALSSVGQKDYARAESFYRKVLDRNMDDATPPDEIREMRLMLAYVCALQENWEEAENIIVPIAMAKGTPEIMAFHGLHALAMIRLDKNEHDLAIKYCKRAVGGHRKFGGKTSAPYHQSMALLARIYHAKGDTVAAEGCESFLPHNYTYPLIPLQPGPYLRIVVEETLSNLHGSPSLSNIAKIDSRSLTPVPDASGRLPPHSRSHSRNVSNSSFAPPNSTSEARNRPVASFREEFSPLSGSDPALSAVEREAALLEMGFDENRVRQAVAVTDTVKDALQWLDDLQRQPSSRSPEHNQTYEATIHPSRETSVRLKHPSQEHGEVVRTEQSFAMWKARSLGERRDDVPPLAEEEYLDHHTANRVGPTPAAHHEWATQSGHSTTSLAVEIGPLIKPPNPGGLRPSKSSTGLGTGTHTAEIARSRSFTGPRDQRRERGKKVEEPQTHELQKTTIGKRGIAQRDYKKAATDEVDFLQGEIIENVVLTNSAWRLGTNSKGERGLFPWHYVKLVEEVEPKGQKEAQVQQETKAQKSPRGQDAVVLQNWMKMSSDELELSEGELITNIDVVNKGWSRGTNSKGETGLFPSNYVKAVYDEETTWQEGARINGKIILREAPPSSVSEAAAPVSKDAVEFKLDPAMPSTIASRRKAWDNRTPEEVQSDMNPVIGMNETSTTASQVIPSADLDAAFREAQDPDVIVDPTIKNPFLDVLKGQENVSPHKSRPASSRTIADQPVRISQKPSNMSYAQWDKIDKRIFGIDLGTESTAVAYVLGVDLAVQPAVIDDWPSADGKHSRVPTLLRYNYEQELADWGFGARKSWSSSETNTRFQVRFSELYNEFLKEYPDDPYLPRKPGNILVGDYLVNLRSGIRTFLAKLLGSQYALTSNMWYSFVVPYDLPRPETMVLRAAAIGAGFGSGPLRDITYTTDLSRKTSISDPSRLVFISDHEAHIVHCAASGILEPRSKDVILVIDIQEAKSDIVSYQVTALQPFSWELYVASSRQISSALNTLRLKFEEILKNRIKAMRLPESSNTPVRVFEKCVRDFDSRIVADFRSNGQNWAVDVGLEVDFPEAGIEEGYMIFSNDDILSCFEPVVNSLLVQIRDQMLANQGGNRTIHHIIVKGRGSTNEYIFRQIELHIPESFGPIVKRSQDTECGDARGAVIATMQHFVLEEDTELAPKLEHEPDALKRIALDLPTLKKSPAAKNDDATANTAEARISAHGYTYLLASPLAWRYPHNSSIMVECPDGISRCSDSAQVILRAGSSYGLIGDRVRIKKYIQFGDSQVFTDHLYSYPGVLNQGFLNESTINDIYPHLVRHPPFSISSYRKDPGCEFEIVGTITTDLSDKDVSDWFQKFRGPTGKWYYEIDYEFIVSLETEENDTSNGKLCIHSVCYDKPIGYLEVPVVLGSNN